jgi:hypothetical protein
VKIWHIPEKGLEQNLCNPECTFSHKQRRVETVCFHPAADCLLTTASYTTITLWDISSEKELLCMYNMTIKTVEGRHHMGKECTEVWVSQKIEIKKGWLTYKVKRSLERL